MKAINTNKWGLVAMGWGLVGYSSAANAVTHVEVNGRRLATSVRPERRNGRTLVPMRDIFEALGATVRYNPNTRGITARRAGTVVRLRIGSSAASVGQRRLTLQQPPVLTRGSTLVPLRFVAEALGARVAWDNARQLASIDQDGTAVAAYRTISIANGTVVPIALDSNLSSANARRGDTFTGTIVSKDAGDSEFPAGSKIEGTVTQAVPKSGKNPGVLDIDFRAAILPDGRRLALQGTPVTLDNNSVDQTRGHITAKKRKDNTTRDVLIGTGAGFVLGKVIGRNSTVTGLLGAALGYFQGHRKSKANDVNLEAGTQIGVRLDQSLSYDDTTGYGTVRSRYLKL